MNKSNDIRHGRHCVFNLHIHLVFLTKYRRSVFTKAVLEDLKEIFASVCQDFEAELVEFDGEKDCPLANQLSAESFGISFS